MLKRHVFSFMDLHTLSLVWPIYQTNLSSIGIIIHEEGFLIENCAIYCLYYILILPNFCDEFIWADVITILPALHAAAHSFVCAFKLIFLYLSLGLFLEKENFYFFGSKINVYLIFELLMSAKSQKQECWIPSPCLMLDRGGGAWCWVGDGGWC